MQNAALRKATGAVYGTSSSALEVITSVAPLDLRLDQTLMMAFLKISRNKGLRLASKIEGLLDNVGFTDHRIIKSLQNSKLGPDS